MTTPSWSFPHNPFIPPILSNPEVVFRARNDCVAHTPGSMRIHPPVSPLRKGGALRRSDPFPFPPYEGGIQGGSSGASVECMQHNREAL